MTTFNHFNFNVFDLERSLAFYKQALGLTPADSPFQLELTWLADRTKPYDLGEQEYHLAFRTDQYDALHEKHMAMGCVCFESPAMGIYFIEDPDGYWIEIVPVRD